MAVGVLGHPRCLVSSLSLPNRSLSPPHKQSLAVVVGGAILVVAIIVPWQWGVLGCPRHLVVHLPRHCPPRPGCHCVLCCPVVLVLIVPFSSGLLSSFCCHSPAGPVVPVPLLPISTHKQLLTAAVGGAVIVVVIFSNSVLFHAICPASRGSQRRCHPRCFIALSLLLLTPSIPLLSVG